MTLAQNPNLGDSRDQASLQPLEKFGGMASDQIPSHKKPERAPQQGSTYGDSDHDCDCEGITATAINWKFPPGTRFAPVNPLY